MNTYITQKFHLCAAVLGAMALALLPSCQDEDFGFTSDEIRQEAYSRNFKEIFGEVDPDHNWSMAQNVKVNINVPGANGYRMRILTEAPTNRETTLLYECVLTGEQFSANVDVVRGTRSLYVEIMSGMGSYLVDGYYNIDEEGNVEVNRMATRALGSAPTCSPYTGTLYRYSRTWVEPATQPTDQNYKYDYGFTWNRLMEYRPQWNDENNITKGWEINCELVTEDGLRKYKDGGYSGGPRVLQLNSSSVDGLNNMQVPRAFYFRNLGNDNGHDAFNEAFVRFGGDDSDYPFRIGDQDFTIHVPLASRNAVGKTIKFELLLESRQNGQWAAVTSKNVEISDQKYQAGADANGDVLFQDFTIDGNSDWSGNNYRLTVKLLTGNEFIQAFCAGYFVEQKGQHPIFTEQVVNGQIKYSDVRGGGVNKYAGNQFFNGRTFRDNGGIRYYNYRTYDTRLMNYQNGEGGTAGGYISNFYIVDSDIKDRVEKIKYRDMFPLYGMYKSTEDNTWKGSPFHEGDNHIDDFFKDDVINPNPKYNMPKDAQIITWGQGTDANGVYHDGSVEAKLVGIGTGWSNDVGYFYYPNTDEYKYLMIDANGQKVLDFNKVPKVIIRRNMQQAVVGDKPNESQIHDDGSMDFEGIDTERYNRFVNGCAALSLTKAERTELLAAGNFNRDGVPNMISSLEGNSVKTAIAIDATFEAPIFKLPFYELEKDNDGKLTGKIKGNPTWVWPSDYVIGFFNIRTDDHTACELARIGTSSASVQLNYFNDLPRGSAFTYKGKTYIGLEDEWDYDNNDFLFELCGVKPVNPDITPNDDPVPDPNRSQDWIIACEDLGGVWDYDFNDLIWAISKEVKSSSTKTTTDIYFTALAAGGTLEAIVEYNTSLALGPGDSGWSESNWVEVGEIHNLVKRTIAKQNGNYVTDVHTQLNVDPEHPYPSRNDIGERIKLGETISSDRGNPNDVTFESILKHFRIRVTHNDNTYVVANVHESLPGGSNHNHEHGGSLDYSNGMTHVPQFILLPKGWAWPAETVCITDVYGLQNWFQNRNETSWLDTWRNSNDGKTGRFIFNPL